MAAVGRLARVMGRLALAAAPLLWIVIVVKEWPRLSVTLSALNTFEAGLLLTTPILRLIIRVGREWVILQAIGHTIGRLRLAAILTASGAITTLTSFMPVGGLATGFGARYLLLERSGVAGSVAVLSGVIDEAVRFAVNKTIVLLVGGYIIVTNFGDPAARLAVMLSGGLTVAGALAVASFMSGAVDRWAARLPLKDSVDLPNLRGNFRSFFGNRRAVGWATSWTVAGFAVEVGLLYSIIVLLGGHTPFWQGFWLQQLQSLPIGVSEVVSGAFTQAVQQNGLFGLAANSLSRARDMIWAIGGGGLMVCWLILRGRVKGLR